MYGCVSGSKLLALAVVMPVSVIIVIIARDAAMFALGDQQALGLQIEQLDARERKRICRRTGQKMWSCCLGRPSCRGIRGRVALVSTATMVRTLERGRCQGTWVALAARRRDLSSFAERF